MPIITVTMYSGRSQRDKDRLAEAITEDVVNMLKGRQKRCHSSIPRGISWKLVCFWSSSLKITIRVKEDISISLKNRTQFYYLN